jgi:hypothetical protein
MEWQKNEIRKIYDNAHRTRRAIISVGALVHLAGPAAIPNSQLYSAA